MIIADKIILTGLKQLNKPYVFNSPSLQTKTFDCSSFIQYIFRENGIALPRNSREQYKVGVKITVSNIKKGDLLFFTTKNRSHRKGIEKIGHVAIFLGYNQILHTHRKGKKVVISDLDLYWKKVVIGATRVISQ
ncbi:hypothetical protein BKP45_11130 [Anaerobacillus alkalidiazotrophicus]|uniref:NlpC/P60 domain-containing protein n=1 Tax=Anaerobacillus alkalidiazotrophicus TaxID=472963 RepID=A0A1S2M0C0_9BACI|nr:C40 family peptidase [Anaerobacillus alkalidiazotrophicus]OIJ18141.1 hypothetical protein BKP45_16845 [Anaerobacillus alkalidiazotrophicus]OIJ19620.1 hypothetical protein BKP45_11130 [Anaerobacillus alkalidiazotrophicus]